MAGGSGSGHETNPIGTTEGKKPVSFYGFRSSQKMAYGQEHWERLGPIGVDCLLPNGIFLSFQCQKNLTIAAIKQLLWQEAKKQPLFHRLREPDNYVFTYVTNKAKLVECVDENEQLDEIRPYKPIFKVLQKEGDRTLSILNNQIGEVIGKTVGEFENAKTAHVHDFRQKMIEKCRQAIKWRNECSWLEKMRYYYPPDVISEEHCLRLLDCFDPSKSQQGFLIQVQLTAIAASSGKEQSHQFSFQYKPEMGLNSLVSMVLSKKAKSAGTNYKEDSKDFILKVIGMDEYLYEDYPLLRYRYIKDCFQQQKSPQLTPVKKDAVLSKFAVEEFVSPQVTAVKPSVGHMSLWEMQGNFSCKVVKATNLHIRRDVNVFEARRWFARPKRVPISDQVQVYAGVYHGVEGYQIMHTGSVVQQGEGSNGRWVWNESLPFNQIEFKDIPHGARLCICIYAIYDDNKKKKRRGRGQEKVALAWANIPLFDFKSQFVAGQLELYCWPVQDSLDEDLNYLGTVQGNPNTTDASCLSISFVEQGLPVYYPEFQELLEKNTQESRKPSTAQRQAPMSKQLQAQWSDIVDKDPLSELLEQDKEYLWSYRQYCFSEHPEALPKLLSAVKWNDPASVAEMYYLMHNWSQLDPQLALELLDYKYQDPEVRKFAVDCLKRMSDSELSRYTLQLVQAVKYESYLDCELARFLLDKAWKNIRIGHYLFWHLRAEMDNPQVSMRFGLLLEAYCRGSPNHIRSLERQTKALGKFKLFSEMLRKSQEKKEKMRENMKAYFKVETTALAVNQLDDILNPRVLLGSMIVDSCKFFDSKMKPLLLTYTNRDKGDERPIKVMFKNGDDLRQDMLTLQILSIMDQLWQQEGVDLKMIPYGCLATGEKTGFIEIVQESETIATIQKRLKRGAGLWQSRLLMEWLKDHNPDPAQWDRAGMNFCHSCAGYCVATYVLGIGDRHSDNIMVTKGGQLFHVDFGHFLGNFKSKFGMKRERVPFVLADDFTIIIEKHMGFNAFSALCENAYLILRRHGYLFITLFAMMLQTGIPELRSIDDLGYMKDALALTVSEDQAKQYFRGKLQEARKKAWSTTMNWYVHGLAKDNSKM